MNYMNLILIIINVIFLTQIELIKLLFVLIFNGIPSIFMKDKRYFINNLLAIDKNYNAIWGGDESETMSSRLRRYRDQNDLAKFFAKAVNAIFFWQKDHVGSSIEPVDHHKDDVLK